MATIEKDRILGYRGQDLYDPPATRSARSRRSTSTPTATSRSGRSSTPACSGRSAASCRCARPRRPTAPAVAHAKDKVKDAPRVDANGQLSQREEAALYEYYGLEYSEASSGLPEGAAGGSPPPADDV